MAILHKNISAEGDIHNPKWFSGANNGDVAWRNELGVLESTDELVLPAALDFVDGSVAPPTSNSGDIYVLSSGASVNAGWGTVSLGDWVRYDGTTWNVITPQKSSLCYNETTDALNSYDGSIWSAIGSGGGGGDSIYTADDTIGAGRVATLTDTLTFKDGTVNIQGAGTSTGSALAIYNNDTTPFKLWDFLDNGKIIRVGAVSIGENQSLTDARTVSLGKNVSSSGFDTVSIGQSLTTSGNYTTNIGTTNTVSGSGGLCVGVFSTVTGNLNFGFGSDNVLTGTKNIGIGLRVYSAFSDTIGIGKALLSNANGASLIANSTADSLALGWNTTTPQHLFKSTGVNLTLPTSSTGLGSGDLWNDGGTVKIA
jgi:hypothetical protein